MAHTRPTVQLMLDGGTSTLHQDSVVDEGQRYGCVRVVEGKSKEKPGLLDFQ